MKNPEKSQAEILLEVLPSERVQAWEKNNIQTAGKSLHGMMEECAKVPSFEVIIKRSVIILFSGLLFAILVSASSLFLIGRTASILSLVIVWVFVLAAFLFYYCHQNKRRAFTASDRKLLKKFAADAMLLLHPTTDLVAYFSLLRNVFSLPNVRSDLVQLAWIILTMRIEFDRVRLKPERHLERIAKLSAAILEHEAMFEAKWKAVLLFEYFKPEDKGGIFAEAERKITS
jgi:hypothetical protein